MGEPAEKQEMIEEVELPLLSSLLSLITPETLENLVSATTAGHRQPLTEMLEKRLGPKIIPIREETHLKEVPEKEYDLGDFCEFPRIPGNVEVISVDAALDEALASQVAEGKIATSVFIISEKKKLERSDRKMKVGGIFQLYKKTSDYVLKKRDKSKEKSISEDDDLDKDASGILINKKHF